jgi:hypothetical protein
VNLRRYALRALVMSATVAALAGCGKSSSITSADPALDTTPPNPPTNLHSAYVQAVNYDYLYWSASTSPSVHGYEVWESTTSGGTYSKIATIENANADNVILPPVSADGTRYYEMRATKTNGVFSAYSAELAVTRHAAASNPGGTTGTPGSGGSGVGLIIPD